MQDYLIGASDMVKISVFDYPDLATEVRVSESGNITFPLIGEISIGGRTANEAEKLIAESLTKQGFVRQAHVTVLVSEYFSQQVSILGNIAKPGRYTLDKPNRLSEILALAGGVAEDGGDKALITRVSENGETQRTEIDLYELFHGDLSKDVQVKSGDMIFIPKGPVYYIYGEVQHAGMFSLHRNMSVIQAISISGGLTPRGTENWVKVKRKDVNGELQSETIELGDYIQANDILYVRESWF
ncbi:MAG: polysaccharide export protein EpsE [Methylomonas sp.]